MSTNPSAMSAYTPPIATPAMSSCTRNVSSGDTLALHGLNAQRNAHDHGLAGPVADLRLDEDLVALAVETRDELRIPLLDESAPHLAGTRELEVIRVQLLVEEDEPADPRGARQVPVDAFDVPRDELVDGRLLREVGVSRVSDLPRLGPLAH